MIKPIGPKPQQAKLFCQEYWERVLQGAKALEGKAVKHHENLTHVNTSAILRTYPTWFNSKELREIIIQSDKEFKLLKPLEQDITVWRGVSEPVISEQKRFMQSFDKAYNTKKGDVIFMSEYPYASNEKNYAELYSSYGSKGIFYEILVPKGAKVSKTEAYVFPRYSKFECTGTEETKVQDRTTKLIKLKYLLPKE